LYPFEYPGQPALWFLATTSGLFVPLLGAFITGIGRAAVSMVLWICLRNYLVTISTENKSIHGFSRPWMLAAAEIIGMVVLMMAITVLFQVMKFSLDAALIVDIDQYTVLLMHELFNLIWIGIVIAAITMQQGIFQLVGFKGMMNVFSLLGSPGAVLQESKRE
jgi:hypothetical protein